MNFIKYRHDEWINLDLAVHIWIQKGPLGFFLMAEIISDEEVVISNSFATEKECIEFFDKIVNKNKENRNKMNEYVGVITLSGKCEGKNINIANEPPRSFYGTVWLKASDAPPRKDIDIIVVSKYYAIPIIVRWSITELNSGFVAAYSGYLLKEDEIVYWMPSPKLPDEL